MNARTFRLIRGLVIVAAFLLASCSPSPAAPPASTLPPAPVPAPLPEPAPVPSQKPASFRVSDLTITPAEATSGSQVTIKVTVSNIGELSGAYDVILKIDGAQQDKETVTLEGGSSKGVAFTVTKYSAGNYSVSVDDQGKTLIVKSPVISAATLPAPPPPAPTGPAWAKRLTANATAANPTWNELISFLITDNTNVMEYGLQLTLSPLQSLEKAISLYNNAEKLGIKSGVVEVKLSQVSFFASVFTTSDYGDVYILSYAEDRIARIEKGEPFIAVALNGIKPYDLKNKYAWDYAVQNNTAWVLLNASLVESFVIYPQPAK